MQLNFDFKKSDSYHLDDFIIFRGNREAYDFINGKFNDENNRIFLLSGGAKSGKSHLAYLWQKLYHAVFLDFNKINQIKDIKILYRTLINFIESDRNYILEDLDKINLEEEKLFHLINIVNEKKARLLIISEKSINDFFFEINDLQSRFNNIIEFKIKNLDNAAKKLYIIKLFADKQLSIDEKVVSFLTKNTSFVYKEIYETIDKIIKNFTQEKRKKLTINFIKNICFRGID
jgi:chromosomal replication initiation ATPase DnaA